MEKITKQQINYIIKLLNEGKDIPQEFKYLLFPTKQKEYELAYAGRIRKEDLLANEDGVSPVPLQIDKVFNGEKNKDFSDGWKNMIIFGDNLQFLKTVYENKDSLIKNKVKGKVKLIYIDPPFGTGDEYEGNKRQKGYSAKRKGSDFVEFLRRRLILAKEILDPNGCILVRQDYHFGDYIKIILDEIFGKDKFKNELIVNRIKKSDPKALKFNVAADRILWYSKTNNYYFKSYFKKLKETKKDRWHAMDSQGQGAPAIISGKSMHPPMGRHWTFSQEKIYELEKQKRIRLSKTGKPQYLIDSTDEILVDSNWTDIPGYTNSTDYPTENSEQLLERIISSLTKEKDIVLDFFAGSGTTAAVAEKLGRRWIVCDIGKFSYYTIQKRILAIKDSKDMKDHRKKYGKSAKSFNTCQLGLYELGKVFKMQEQKYKEFVSSLFEIELKSYKIAGFEFDGKKGEYPVKIFDWKKFKDASVDKEYLKSIHSIVSKRISDRIYVIAPANYVDFITDYYEIDGIRYYFLKIPYQVIRELHKISFQKLRQPQSKKNVNDLDEVVGFHFIRQPEVRSSSKLKKDLVELSIKEFKSQYYKDEAGQILDKFETLAMVLVDTRYNEKHFAMKKIYFADELLGKVKNEVEEKEVNEEKIRKKLKQKKEINITFKKSELGKKTMVVYIDIYGNEFRETLKLRKS